MDDEIRKAEAVSEDGDEKYAVLEVFGLKLEVSNERLADLLTMDADEALQQDLKDLSATRVKEVTEEAGQAVPDVMLTPATPHDDQDARHRQEIRERVASLGSKMGFTTSPDGVWESPTGVTLLTRLVDKTVSFAAASHFVEQVEARRPEVCGEECTALFIAEEQQTSDVLKVAIRQKQLHHLMRTVSLANLEEVVRMTDTGDVDHSHCVVLLAPVADIDVGEMLSVIRSASEPEGS